jgi:hypothetical protein
VHTTQIPFVQVGLSKGYGRCRSKRPEGDFTRDHDGIVMGLKEDDDWAVGYGWESPV